MDVDGRLKERVEVEPSLPVSRPRWSTLGSVGPAMLVTVAGLILVYSAPALEFARPWNPGDPVPFWNLLGRPFEEPAPEEEEEAEAIEAIEAVAQEVLAAEPPKPPVDRAPQEVIELDEGEKLPPYVARPGDDAEVVQQIELFEGDELDRFFSALAHSDAGVADAITRVVHWGDSAIGVDGIPGAIRQRMQARFGDSGHGFHLMAQPNSSYRHREVEFAHNDSWRKCFIIFKCSDDGRYGLGGTTFRSRGGAQSSFRPHQDRSGGKVSQFDVWYAAQPKGGVFTVRVDGGERTRISTEADELEDRWHSIEVEDGDHKLEVRAAGEGTVRLYGVTMERSQPGVVWDGLAQIGAFTSRMLELDTEHLKAQLGHRQPDLAVFMFGGNDMQRKIKMATYEAEYREVIKHVVGARPEMDCLVMAPLDHGEHAGARVISQPVVARMVAAQRAAAKAEGCAFFDTWSAMGGEGSAGRWFHRKPRLISGDLSHATGKGHQVIGELFYRALVHSYVRYRTGGADDEASSSSTGGTTGSDTDGATGDSEAVERPGATHGEVAGDVAAKVEARPNSEDGAAKVDDGLDAAGETAAGVAAKVVERPEAAGERGPALGERPAAAEDSNSDEGGGDATP